MTIVNQWRWNHDGSIISSFCFLGRRFFPRCFLSNHSSSSCCALSSPFFLISSSSLNNFFCLALNVSHSSSQSNLASPFCTMRQGKSFFLRRQGHLTEDFLLHSSEDGQGPLWQLDEHRWPQTTRFFGHWFLQDISLLRVCSSTEVNSLHDT